MAAKILSTVETVGRSSNQHELDGVKALQGLFGRSYSRIAIGVRPGLFFTMQGRPYNQSVRIDVTPADEPAVRAWLTERVETMRQIWQPLLG